MLASDRLALQDLFMSVCAKADWYHLSTCDAQAVVDDIIHTARTILADACHHRNQSMSSCAVPPEVLATCFAFLPPKGRVNVSHVSRTWRTVAIECPSLWNDITCASGDDGLSPALVKLAFTRSGSLPIQLDHQGWLNTDTANLIHMHLHRVASLKLYSYASLAFLNHPAPLLHSLILMDDASLSEEFLARTPGRLATLHAYLLVLPGSCPGLSALTTLHASSSRNMTLSGIFGMCPCLRSLSLWHLKRNNISSPGQPPDSLATLSLSTNHRDCNLIAVYEAFKDSNALQRISLHCNMVGRARDFGHVLHGAVEMDVNVLAGGAIVLSALFSSGRRLTISWPLDNAYAATDQRAYPPFFAQAVPCFENLRTVSMPLSVLPFFILDAPPLPVLEQLRAEITPGTDLRGELEESEMDGLRGFTATRPDFRLVFHVAHPRGTTADDAQLLLRRLSDCATHLAVTVTGFAADAIPDAIPRELNVTFVPNAQMS